MTKKENSSPFSTKHFVWVHVPKTGGTWLYRVLVDTAPASWEAVFAPPLHVCFRDLSDRLADAGVPERFSLPILAGVRNPWDWYVSLYFFMEQRYHKRMGGFRPPPAEWSPGCRAWKEFYTRGNHVDGFREALPVLLSKMHDEGNEAVVPPQSVFLRTPAGQLGVTPVRFEGLRENIIEAIEATGAQVPDQMRRLLTGRQSLNASTHGPYQDYYSPELREMVAQREAWLIETLGYTFEQP